MNTLGNLGWWASGVILLIKCWTHWLTLSSRLAHYSSSKSWDLHYAAKFAQA